jgi:hypothetical protein
MASSRSRHSASWPGNRWPYRSSVKLTDVWPARTLTSLGLAPAAIHGAKLGAGARQVGLAQRPQPAAELVVAVHQQRADLVGGLGAGLDRAAAGHHQRAQFPDGAVAVLGDGTGIPGQHRAGCCLGVDRVALALAASPGPVRAIHLDHIDALVGEVLGEPVAVAGGALHPALATWP